jgi:hypothetical protein
LEKVESLGGIKRGCQELSRIKKLLLLDDRKRNRGETDNIPRLVDLVDYKVLGMRELGTKFARPEEKKAYFFTTL